MAIIEEGVCKIESINSKGMGVGVSNYGAVELPCASIGDVVRFERHRYRNRTNCVLVEVLEEGPYKQQPACKYFARCGGCQLQHLLESDYIRLKVDMLKTPLAKFGISCKVKEPIFVSKASRRRANFEAVKRQEGVLFGFHRFHSNHIVNIDNCPALLPNLSNLISPLAQMLDQILDLKQKAQIFLTQGANGVDLTLEIYRQPRLSLEQREHLLEFAARYNLIKLTFRAKKFIDIVHLQEEPFVLFDQVPVGIDAHCSLQASSQSDQILQNLVLSYASYIHPGNKVVDLFCGRGTYTLPLSKDYIVDGYESDPKAIAALRDASIKAGRSIELYTRDLFQKPLDAQELNKYSFAVLNPPRAGAQSQVKALAASQVASIVYISCNPETFAADAQILLAENYQLVEVTPFDQFYWSAHLELVGYFTRSKI